MTEHTRYCPCPFCGDQQTLSRGLWRCRDLAGCGYTEPDQAALRADQDQAFYRRLLRRQNYLYALERPEEFPLARIAAALHAEEIP